MGRAHEVRAAAMAKTAAAKTKVYSRYGKEIYMAARGGVPDPDMNSNLKHMIEKAKAAQVPMDVIKRNIEKAKGSSAEAYVETMYEGFGPEGSTILVECLSDNSNRSLAEVRNSFNKARFNLGKAGCVSYAYNTFGILQFAGDEDKALEALLMGEVDVKDYSSNDGVLTIYVDPRDLYKAKDALESSMGELKFDILEQRMIPQEYISLSSDESKAQFQRMLDLLDDIDDVQEVYHNVDNLN